MRLIIQCLLIIKYIKRNKIIIHLTWKKEILFLHSCLHHSLKSMYHHHLLPRILLIRFLWRRFLHILMYLFQWGCIRFHTGLLDLLLGLISFFSAFLDYWFLFCEPLGSRLAFSEQTTQTPTKNNSRWKPPKTNWASFKPLLLLHHLWIQWHQPLRLLHHLWTHWLQPLSLLYDFWTQRLQPLCQLHHLWTQRFQNLQMLHHYPCNFSS